MRVGSATDPVEAEADLIAESIVHILRQQAATTGVPVASRTTHGAPTVAQAPPTALLGGAGPTDPAELVARPTGRIGAAGGELDHRTATAISGLRGLGRPLPEPTLRRMEAAFDADFSEVRVHTGGLAARLNNDLQAQAFTVGSDIVLSEGLPRIAEVPGQRLLAHELAHVVQQRGPNRLAALRRQSDRVERNRPSRSRNDDRWSGGLRNIRRKWLATGKDLTWDKVLGGLEWHYNRDKEAFFYLVKNPDAIGGDRREEVVSNAGRLLSEEDLRGLGFEQIAFDVGDDRVEFSAPAPKWGVVGQDMVTMVGSAELVARLTKQLKMQTVTMNYDRVVYINAFILFKAQNPKLSEDEALARFDARSAEVVKLCQGGHCGGLSGSLLREEDYGPGAYLVGSILPKTYQQKKAPEYCHVAAMIRFQNPETAEDNGLILLEPGFNITTPIVVKKGVVTSLDQGPEIWDFTVDDGCTEVVCQPRDAKGATWAASKSRDKRMTYRTDVFLNPDESLTVPLLRVDGRPVILARDETGAVVANIVVNYVKGTIELRIGTTKFDPTPFDQVDRKGAWLKGAEAALAKLVHLTPEELIGRLYDAAHQHKPK